MNLKESSIKQSIEEAIQMGWLSKNPHVNLDAIIYKITGDLEHNEREDEKNKKISLMLEIMNDLMPDKFAEFMKILQKKSKNV